MLKVLFASLAIFLLSSAAIHAGSGEMIISPNSDFSDPSQNFSTGQTIYVKVEANSQGTQKHDLNLRDNSYNLISTYNLENKGGNTFSGFLPAPKNSGYYSLEAKVESPGAVTTKVKTIKIGTGVSANVKLNVDVHTSGEKVTSQSSIDKNSTPSPSGEPTPTPQPEVETAKDVNLFARITLFFQNLFASIF